MPDPRNSTALCQLADLGRQPVPSRRAWAVGRPEPGGRLRLPADARAAIGFRPGERTEVRGVCQRIGLLITADHDSGARLVVDRWGRLMLPAWLRRSADRSLLIGSDVGASTLVLASVGVLDNVGDLLVGRPRREPAAARVLLEEARALGLDLADLLAASATTADRVPTVATYVEAVTSTVTAATAATYRPHWRLAVARFGDRRLDQVGLEDLIAVVDAAVERAQRNRPGSTGRASREACVAALRALFSRAAAAGLVTANPAAALTKPRRARSRRRALDDDELAELIAAVRTTSRDPDLDLLVLRFHLESGARRQGALDLRGRDLDAKRATLWLREKGDTEREQPVSPSLLAGHAASRCAAGPDDQVLRTSDGRPLSARRYDTIFGRAAPRSPGRNGPRCPPALFATPPSPPSVASPATPLPRPSPATPPRRSTGRYLHATLSEVAAAVATLTGESHPLADGLHRLRDAGASRCARR